MRQICQTLGFNKSTFYYQPKSDASEEVLRAEIQRLAKIIRAICVISENQ